MGSSNEAFQREVLGILRDMSSRIEDMDERIRVIEKRTRGPSLKGVARKFKKKSENRH